MNDGQFLVQITGGAGADYAIQAPTDLLSWLALFATNFSTQVFNFVDANATNYAMFRGVNLIDRD